LKPIADSVLDLSNVWAVPFFDDSFVQSLNRYRRVFMFSDVYVGNSTNYDVQMHYVEVLQPVFVRVKHLLDLTGYEAKRVVGSTLFVLHYAKDTSAEFAEYFSFDGTICVEELDLNWLESYFIWYNTVVRCTVSLIPSRITKCSCYDCMWLDMWLVFRHPVRLIGKFSFPDFYCSSFELSDYSSIVNYISVRPNFYTVLGYDFNGKRCSTDVVGNYFSYGFVDVAVKMQYRRVDCYAFYRYSFSKQLSEMFVVPKLFVIFDYSIMTFYVRYRNNFEIRNLSFTYADMLDMGSVCLECIDVERFVIGVSVLRSCGLCVVNGLKVELVASASPLLLCRHH